MEIYVQMHGVVTSLPSEEELNKLSYDLVSTFGKENFSHFLYDNGTTYERHLALTQIDSIDSKTTSYYDEHYCICGGEIVEVKPEEGEYFIKVGLSGVYSDSSYLHGNFWLYESVAEWLECRMPGIVIYCSDDKDYCTKLTKEFREELWKRYVLYGRDTYYDVFSYKHVYTPHAYIQHPLCPLCKIKMHLSGGNQDEMKAKFNCRACDRNLITEDGGERYHLIPSKWNHINKEMKI